MDAGQGDLVMTSKVAATTSRILLTDYIVVPDENRGATRLQGAAEVSLGSNVAFNAVISGGVLALPPARCHGRAGGGAVRDRAAAEGTAGAGGAGDSGDDRHGHRRGRPARLRAAQSCGSDAATTGSGWTISQLTGVLPGDATVTLTGDVDVSTGRPEFAGNLALRSERLDALSTLWRGLADGNPLFGMPGGIAARLNLVGETLSISDASVELDGQKIPFSAQIGLGTNRDLHLSADVGELDAARSAALLALLPDLKSDVAFPVTFPKGEFELSAARAEIAGLEGRDLVARGSWDGGVLVVDEVSAADLGGARFDAALTAFGSVLKPELSGTANIAVESADAPALARLYAALGTSERWRVSSMTIAAGGAEADA